MVSNDREILLEISGKLSKIELRLDSIESRVGNLESGVEKLDARVEKLESGVGNLESQVGSIAAAQNRMAVSIDKIESNQRRMAVSIGRIEPRLSSLETSYHVMHEDIRVNNTRIETSAWFTGLCFAVLAMVIAFVSIFAPKILEHFTHKDNPDTQPVPAPSSTVINIPQPDIHTLAAQVAEILKLEAKH